MAERRVRKRNEDFIFIESDMELSNLDAKLLMKDQHPENFGVEFIEWEKCALRWEYIIPKIRATRFQDQATMEGLGIEGDLRTLFRRVEMEEFFDKRPPTYLHLTAEFMNTLEVHRDRNKFPIAITFQLNNEMWEKIPVNELNRFFGCPIMRGHQNFLP